MAHPVGGVKGDALFSALTTVSPQTDAGLFQCLNAPDAGCNNSAASRAELAQMMAAHLTSFTGLAGGADQRIVETEFVYDNTWDKLTTWGVPYMENGQVRFYNTRGEEWRYYTDNGYHFVQEVGRDGYGNVTLQDGDSYYIVPVSGGTYSYQTADGDAAPVADLVPFRQSWLTGYYENNQLSYLYNGGNYWVVYQDGRFRSTQELRRHDEEGGDGVYAVINDGARYLSIPAQGGGYFTDSPENQWVPAGQVQVPAKSDIRAYYANNQIQFIFLGGDRWRVHQGDQYVDVTEVRRFLEAGTGLEIAEIPFGESFFSVPLDGGQYLFAGPGEQWQVAGELVMYPVR